MENRSWWTVQTKFVCLADCVSRKYRREERFLKLKLLKYGVRQGKHETVLHPDKSQREKVFVQGNTSHHAENSSALACSSTMVPIPVIKVRAKHDHVVALTCLVDQGSQSSYIAEDLVQKLRLHTKSKNVEISRVGGDFAGKVSSIVDLTWECGAELETKAFVIKRVRKGELPGWLKLFPTSRLSDCST